MIYHHVYKLWLLSLLEDHGNFKDASNFARITQSALSQNLSSLEAVLKRSLVVRERGSVALTEDGIKLMQKVRPILRSLDIISFGVSNSKSLSGNIRLGAYESIAVEYLPRLLKKIGALHPELKLDVYTSRSEDLVKLVRKGTLDMALVINGQDDSKVDSEVLFHDELGVFISERLAKYGESLENHKDIGLATISSCSEGYPRYYKDFFKQLPSDLKVIVTCDSFEAIRSLAFSGALIGLLPNKVAQRTDGLVKIWPLSEADSTVSEHTVTLVSRKNIARGFTDLVKEELQMKHVD